MTPHTIVIHFSPSDVNFGLVRQVARSNVLHIIEGEELTTTESTGFRLAFTVLASGLPEAERTARVLLGALAPLVEDLTVVAGEST